MIVSYASTSIRDLCENYAVSAKAFSGLEVKTLRAALSDIAAASHVGEVIGMDFQTSNGAVITESQGCLQISLGVDLLCTLQSTLSKPAQTAVAIETIRRLRVDSVGGLE